MSVSRHTSAQFEEVSAQQIGVDSSQPATNVRGKKKAHRQHGHASLSRLGRLIHASGRYSSEQTIVRALQLRVIALKIERIGRT